MSRVVCGLVTLNRDHPSRCGSLFFVRVVWIDHRIVEPPPNSCRALNSNASIILVAVSSITLASMTCTRGSSSCMFKSKSTLVHSLVRPAIIFATVPAGAFESATDHLVTRRLNGFLPASFSCVIASPCPLSASTDLPGMQTMRLV